MKPITVKLDVTKIDKTALFKGKSGTYLDLAIWPNKDGVRYGQTHYVVQQLSKERRDKGERGPIVGNATVPDVAHEAAQATRKALGVDNMDGEDARGDDVPF